MVKKMLRGRFAPTPSGRIHLGNIFCSMLAWLHVKKNGGQILLRIEDLDSVRCPRSNADALAKDLEWFGLTWDEGAYTSNGDELFFQSRRFAIYDSFLQKLKQQGLLYPCFCSRAELHAAEAPHFSDGRTPYSGKCRSLTQEEIAVKSRLRSPAYRVITDSQPVIFTDLHYGKQSYVLSRECGDFIVRRSDGIYAYQLAVTVDDALMGITEVVRGCDLLSSTPMQLYLYKLLDLTPPQFFHIPLLTAGDGRRLAKRDNDLSLDVIRKKYDNPEAIIGYLAYLAGQIDKPEPVTPQALLKIFDADKLPKENIIVPSQLPEL